MLLGLALMTHFYYAHCENRSRLYRHNATAAAWLSAQLAFRSTEPEPYLLTDPQSYAGVELASISDPLLVGRIRGSISISGSVPILIVGSDLIGIKTKTSGMRRVASWHRQRADSDP